MPDATGSEAWLKAPNGRELPLQGACFIGRGAMNTLVLADNRVSARHAMVHSPVPGEYWVIDLGSRNGSFLNDRLIHEPRRLRDGDYLGLGGSRLVFRQPRSGQTHESAAPHPEQTLQDIKQIDCWLLVADIEAYTQFIQRCDPAEVASVTGNWLAGCKQLVEANGGLVNNTLGDGFLAYWLDRPEAAERVALTLHQLQSDQARETPRFRVVTHFGTVFLGGAASPGKVSILGAEVNFVFRMEKLASSLAVRTLLSAQARDRLPPGLAAVEEGRHPLQGFDGAFLFFTY